MMQQYNLLVLETTQTQQYKQQQRPHGHQCFPICFSRRVLGHHFYLYYIPNICSISTLNNFGTTLNRMMSTDAAMHSALKIRGEKCNLRKYLLLFASKVNMACRRHLRSKKLQQKNRLDQHCTIFYSFLEHSVEQMGFSQIQTPFTFNILGQKYFELSI